MPSNALEPLLQRLGRLDVEVVGRLVEQQQRRAGQLEQQDLQPRLLAARQRLEPLLGGVRELVAVERPRGLLARHPVARGCVAAVQDLQQRAADQLGVRRGSARTSPAAPARRAGPGRCASTGSIGTVADRPVLDVGVGAAGREQPQEVRLARAVGAQHGHPLAVPDLEVERLHQPGQLELLADDRPLAGAAARAAAS